MELIIYYLFCPGGVCPAGFWFSVCCVNPLPVHVDCWPPGEFPPLFVQPVPVDDIFAYAGLIVATIVAANPTAAPKLGFQWLVCAPLW